MVVGVCDSEQCGVWKICCGLCVDWLVCVVCVVCLVSVGCLWLTFYFQTAAPIAQWQSTRFVSERSVVRSRLGARFYHTTHPSFASLSVQYPEPAIAIHATSHPSQKHSNMPPCYTTKTIHHPTDCSQYKPSTLPYYHHQSALPTSLLQRASLVFALRIDRYGTALHEHIFIFHTQSHPVMTITSTISIIPAVRRSLNPIYIKAAAYARLPHVSGLEGPEQCISRKRRNVDVEVSNTAPRALRYRSSCTRPDRNHFGGHP